MRGCQTSMSVSRRSIGNDRRTARRLRLLLNQNWKGSCHVDTKDTSVRSDPIPVLFRTDHGLVQPKRQRKRIGEQSQRRHMLPCWNVVLLHSTRTSGRKELGSGDYWKVRERLRALTVRPFYNEGRPLRRISPGLHHRQFSQSQGF